MEITLNNQQRYPVGTTVKAYLASGWAQAQLPPSGAPVGEVADEAVVAADGAIAFDLPVGSYFAYAKVGSEHRYMAFSVRESAAIAGGGAFYTTHTWLLHDAIKVPAGDENFLAPTRLKLRGNQSAKIVKVEYRCNNGAGGINFTFKLQKNGEDITGFTALKTPAEAAWKETDPEDKALADNDSLAPVVTAIEGEPKNGSITIVLEHTVT